MPFLGNTKKKRHCLLFTYLLELQSLLQEHEKINKFKIVTKASASVGVLLAMFLHRPLVSVLFCKNSE